MTSADSMQHAVSSTCVCAVTGLAAGSAVRLQRAVTGQRSHAVQVNKANLVKELPSNLRFLVSTSSRHSETPPGGALSFRCVWSQLLAAMACLALVPCSVHAYRSNFPRRLCVQCAGLAECAA